MEYIKWVSGNSDYLSRTDNLLIQSRNKLWHTGWLETVKENMETMKCALWIILMIVTVSASVNPTLHNKNWTRSEKMDPNGILQMQWHIKDKDIVFKITVNSRGFVAVGFLPNPKYNGFDMALAWINDRTGKANILVSLSMHIKFARNHQQQSGECIFWRMNTKFLSFRFTPSVLCVHKYLRAYI